MTIPALTSPELLTLNKTKQSLDARERLVKADVTLLRERIAGAGSQDNVEDKESNIALILAGEDIAFTVDLNSKLSSKMLEWRAIDDAKDALSRKIAKARYQAATKLCDALKPEHDALMKRLCESLAAAHSAHAELYAIQRELTDKRIGLIGSICALMPEFLDAPVNRYSAMAIFFREAAKQKYLRAVPKEFA